MFSFVEYITDELTTILSQTCKGRAGKLELLSTSLNVARSYAKKMFERADKTLKNKCLTLIKTIHSHKEVPSYDCQKKRYACY